MNGRLEEHLSVASVLYAAPFIQVSLLFISYAFFQRETNQPLRLRAIWSSCNQLTNAFLAIPFCPRRYVLPSPSTPLQSARRYQPH